MLEILGAWIRRFRKGADPSPDRVLDHGSLTSTDLDVDVPGVHYEDEYGRRVTHDDEEG